MASISSAQHHAYQPSETTVSAKHLHDLPQRERERITTELKRIHKIVSSHDREPFYKREENKA